MSSLRTLVILLAFGCMASITAYAGNNGNSEDSKCTGMDMEESAEITDAVKAAQAESTQTLIASFEQVKTALQKMVTNINTTSSATTKTEEINRGQLIPFYTDFVETLKSNMEALSLTETLRTDLNTCNEQTVLGYAKTDCGQTRDFGEMEKEEGVYSKGEMPAIVNLYDTHVKLFCIPGTVNAPPGCGSGRAAAGIKNLENFTDFLVGEKTWKKAYVFDVMKLSRAYFGLVTDTSYLADMKLDRETFVIKQGTLARNNVRIALLNYLAARRAPTSTASSAVQNIMLRNLGNSGLVDGTNADTVCTRDPEDMSPFEQTVCSYTNDPDAGSANKRIISQAAMDRIMQFDFYLSPNFYKTITGSTYNSVGPMDKMEVMMKAQQLAQDYHQLRLLQMKTAAVAMNMMGGGY